MKDKLTISETTLAKNWPAGRRPEWADDNMRLYSGFVINAAGTKWRDILAVYEDGRTTAYLTRNGFNVTLHGPAIHVMRGKTACYRKVVREWFRDSYGLEVEFA